MFLASFWILYFEPNIATLSIGYLVFLLHRMAWELPGRPLKIAHGNACLSATLVGGDHKRSAELIVLTAKIMLCKHQHCLF